MTGSNPINAVTAPSGAGDTLNWTYTIGSPTIVTDARDHLQRVGDELVRIPGQTIADETWQAWVDEVFVEHDRRQAAREAYNQEQQAVARRAALATQELTAAQATAKALLFGFLSPAQRRAWNEHKSFEAEINGQVYRFTEGTHGNVYKLREGRSIERFCIAPRAPHEGGRLPVEDVILAQMLLLQNDEQQFRRVANITPLAA